MTSETKKFVAYCIIGFAFSMGSFAIANDVPTDTTASVLAITLSIASVICVATNFGNCVARWHKEWRQKRPWVGLSVGHIAWFLVGLTAGGVRMIW